MKKIILIFTTILIVVSSLLLFASARDNEDYTSVLEFQNNPKAYPIMNGLENAIGFGEYYGTKNFNFECFPDENNEKTLNVRMVNGSVTLSLFEIGGNYPTFHYTLPDVYKYSDIAFVNIDNSYFIAGATTEGYKTIVNMGNITYDIGNSFWLGTYSSLATNLREGYRVEFPFNPIDDMEKPLMQNLIDGLKEFVPGIAVAFPVAFTSIFMTNGHFNALSIVILSFFGLAVGYGVVRFITGLFRKET